MSVFEVDCTFVRRRLHVRLYVLRSDLSTGPLKYSMEKSHHLAPITDLVIPAFYVRCVKQSENDLRIRWKDTIFIVIKRLFGLMRIAAREQDLWVRRRKG